MLALEIIGGLLLVWVALECMGLGIDWVEKHASELKTWAVILATLGGLYMWLGGPGIAAGVVLLILVGVGLQWLDGRKASRKP